MREFLLRPFPEHMRFKATRSVTVACAIWGLIFAFLAVPILLQINLWLAAFGGIAGFCFGAFYAYISILADQHGR